MIVNKITGLNIQYVIKMLLDKAAKSIFMMSCLALTVLLVMIGCSRNDTHDFSNVEKIVTENPRAALDSLRNIDYTYLSEEDRHYCDFLLIKAMDKDNERHESDSLIMEVLGYYERQADEVIYPEVLYYCGRVYINLGNSPMALTYFQRALAEYPCNSINPIRCVILSQTGELLQDMGFPQEGIPYLKELIRINKVQRDTVNLVYNLQMLGNMCVNAGMYDDAEYYFNEAYAWGKQISAPFRANTVHMPTSKALKIDLDSTLFISGGSHSKAQRTRCYQFISTAFASLKAGELDSAYKYARILVEQPDTNSRESGYRILLNPEMNRFSTVDSLASYVTKYRDIIEKYRGNYALQRLYVRNASYNYSVQQKERLKDEKNIEVLVIIVLMLLVVTFLVIGVYYYRKSRWQRERIELYEAEKVIEQLKKRISEYEEEKGDMDCDKNSESDTQLRVDRPIDNESLRKSMREELLELGKTVVRPVAVSETLRQSAAWAKLMGFVDRDEYISDHNSVWEELDRAVMSQRPDFKHNLEVLSGAPMNERDWHMALLIRCGVTPTQMTHVFGREKGTISYYRRNLCRLVLGPEVRTSDVDDIIRLL